MIQKYTYQESPTVTLVKPRITLSQVASQPGKISFAELG